MADAVAVLAGGTPISVDGRPYRGWNALVLAMVAAERGWPSNRWATYRGGSVTAARSAAANEAHASCCGSRPTAARRTRVRRERRSHLDRLFARVVHRLRRRAGRRRDRFVAQAAEVDSEARRIAEAELYFAGRRTRRHRRRPSLLRPRSTRSACRHLAQFERPAVYYSTAAHEHVHWTGHESRLGRDLTGRFGDHAYGAEELIAELGAAFWCAQFGLEQATRDDHAAYLGDWLAMLLRTDARALVARAATPNAPSTT
jgi:antirestriction protein ArdC